MNYDEFIKQKTHVGANHGIEAKYIPDCLFDYQEYVLKYAVKKGRCAVFLDTGLGKTLIELAVAQNYLQHTNKPVLILAPLAVAFQFIKESEKFNIGEIEYSKDGKFSKDIVITNYERLDKFNASDFDCVILDESSILKNFDGKIKHQITAFLKKVDYRFLFTATPSPNDFTELGTSSEALGYMGYTDMLTRFFTNSEKTIKQIDKIGNKWALKGHAQKDFFRWVSSWSISMRKPSDLGFDDSNHILPKLIVNEHLVRNQNPLVVNGQTSLFAKVAVNFSEIRAELKSTIEERCEKAVSLAMDGTCVYWCNRNDESDTLKALDPNAVEIRGSMNIDKKEEVLLAFSNGEIDRLITKPKMTAFGLNWQHSNHTVYFPSFSYEQYYQSIRRFWRFGQKKDVTVDLVYSDGQKRVIQSLREKAKKANELFNSLNVSVNSGYENKKTSYSKKVVIPNWLN